MKPIKKAVIPVAGMGTRFLPVTKSVPKEMFPLVDIPIIHYIIAEAVESGIKDIILITGRGKDSIEDYFDKAVELESFLQKKDQVDDLKKVQQISNLADIYYIRQKEPKGLGHAILQAQKHIGEEPFAVLLGDEVFKGEVPATKQLIQRYNQVGSSILAVRTVSDQEVSSYGIIKPKKSNDRLIKTNRLVEVEAMVEKPPVEKAPSNLAIVGRYILSPQVFAILDKTPPGHNSEIQLTDALQIMTSSEKIYAAEIQGQRYDVGDKLGYLKANLEFALDRDELKDKVENYLISIKGEI